MAWDVRVTHTLSSISAWLPSLQSRPHQVYVCVPILKPWPIMCFDVVCEFGRLHYKQRWRGVDRRATGQACVLQIIDQGNIKAEQQLHGAFFSQCGGCICRFQLLCIAYAHTKRDLTSEGGALCSSFGPSFLPVHIQDNQCPFRSFNPCEIQAL